MSVLWTFSVHPRHTNRVQSRVPNFMLTREQALVLIEKQINAIASNWSKVCAEAELGETERKLFQTRQFLNPYVFENLEKDAKVVMEAARAFRSNKLV